MGKSSDPVQTVRWAIGSWRRADLAQFAEERCGYMNTDIGAGITYASDLDDYDRDVDGIFIPDGCVRASTDWGGQEADVPEWQYLEILAEELDAEGLTGDAARVRALRELRSRSE